MQYMLIHAVDDELAEPASQSSVPEAGCGAQGMAEWLEAVTSQKVDIQGARLCPASDATTVRARQGEVLVTDGPFAETKEQVAGYDILECADQEEALRWASQHPTAGQGAIEVRPLAGDPIGPLPGQRPGTTRYLMLVCAGPDAQPSPEQAAKMSPDMDRWLEETGRDRTRLAGQRLQGSDQARSVRRRQGDILVSDGPFTETKEVIVGFDVLECTDLDEAIQVAARHPVTQIGTMELRPFWPNSQD